MDTPFGKALGIHHAPRGTRLPVVAAAQQQQRGRDADGFKEQDPVMIAFVTKVIPPGSAEAKTPEMKKARYSTLTPKESCPHIAIRII